MAIRQTKSGTLPKDCVYHGICMNCHAQYECQQKDLNHKNKLDCIRCETPGCDNEVCMVLKTKDKTNYWDIPISDRNKPTLNSEKKYVHHIDGYIGNNDPSNLVMVNKEGA